METRLQKWGNSLAIRIPKLLAAQLGLVNHSLIEFSLRGQELVITPARRTNLKLSDLLAGVTEENLHEAIDTGPAAGREAW